MTPEAATAFVAANTRPGHHPLVPEITLHLADRILPIWEASEETLLSQSVDPPFWAFSWPGGVAMARYLLDHGDIVVGKRVLDVAAGSGIAAIAAAMAGAEAVMGADIDSLARAAMALNAGLNGATIQVLETDVLAAAPPVADLILAADVFYERPLTAKILPWLQTARGRGAEVLIADPGRNYLPEAGLDPLARYDVATTAELEDREIKETVIYRLTA